VKEVVVDAEHLDAPIVLSDSMLMAQSALYLHVAEIGRDES
jgi:hypothetical protein